MQSVGIFILCESIRTIAKKSPKSTDKDHGDLHTGKNLALYSTLAYSLDYFGNSI